MVLLDEGYNRLPVIFGDVLGLVLKFLLVEFFAVVVVGVGSVLILRDAFELRDDPRLLVEVGGGVVSELGEDGVGELDEGGLPVLPLDDAVEHAVVFLEVIIVGEDVVEFHFAEAFALVLLVGVVVEGEVEDGGAVAGFDQD
jgi:hypothetical protein